MKTTPNLEEWCKTEHKEHLLEQWDRKANQIGPDEIYYRSQTPVHWVCPQDPSHQWLAAPARRICEKTGQCPYCSGRFLLPEKNSLAALRPDLAAQFDQERNGIGPDQIFAQDNHKYWWKCPAGHQWSASPNSRAKQTGECPDCAHRRPSPQYNLQTECPLIAEEWACDKNERKPTDYLPHSTKAVWWRCRFHPDSVWQSRICYRTESALSNCPVCQRERNTSFPEQAVYYYLRRCFPDAENRCKIDGWEVDIYLSTIHLVIEYDGYRYHASERTKDRERRKAEALQRKGISVLRIKEYELGQDTPPDEQILWCPISTDYKKHLFLEKLLPELAAWINQHYGLHLVIRPDIQRDTQAILARFITRKKEHSLAAKAPDLAKTWHPTRNGPVTPDLVADTACKSFWWLCEKGHEWKMTVRNRVHGGSCPYCSGKRVTRETSLAYCNPSLAKLWHPTKNGELTPWHVTSKSGKQVWWLCEKGHEWKMSICDGAKGNRCPYCSHHRVTEENSLALRNPRLAREWNAARNPPELNPETVSYSSGKKVWWICEKQHEWQEKVGNRTHLGLNCPYCSGRRVTPENNLAVLFPETAAEWHPSKNGTMIPEKFLPKSNQKVWWQCARGHMWEATICSRTLGTGCPYCTGKRASPENSLAVHNPQAARYWHPIKNGALTPKNVLPNAQKEVWWRCEQGHEWKRKICYMTKTSICPYCRGSLSTKENSLSMLRPDLAAEWHPTRNIPLAPHDLTLKSTKRVWWKCEQGHEWQMDIRTRASGIGNCPYCMGKRVCPENSLAALHPKIAGQWHPTKNGALTPQQVTDQSSQKVWWCCENGHEWQALIRSRTRQHTGCPVCAGKAASPHYNLVTEFPLIAMDWDREKNKKPPETYLPFSNQLAWWKCSVCGANWQQKIIYRTKAKHPLCPICGAFHETPPNDP